MVARGVYVEYRHISMPRLGFFALEDIEAGEELTFDYAYQNIGGNIRCKCGSVNCRGFLR
jgi:SET domain-containing protein